ncbi:adhesion G protein-coupled receptor E3-like isoform X2 [Ostrea edulis]|uniref:adhesion G protein-coupled receptor E3-like isoform X2 n=1 Tax=Ostrea edulis TaxID=37623 RepID=UPI0024AF2940|nr:adhesion G protein-coupled receptor E3-like isoform X2 [Ostrea edulis]
MRAHQIFVVAIAICMQIHLSFGAGPVFKTGCTATDKCPDGATCTLNTGCTCDDDLFPVDSGVTLEGIELVICHAPCNPSDGDDDDCNGKGACIPYYGTFMCDCDEGYEGDFCETESTTTTSTTTTTTTTPTNTTTVTTTTTTKKKTGVFPLIAAGAGGLLLLSVLAAAAASSSG